MPCFKTDLFVICSVLCYALINGQFRSSCTTPNGETSRCISIRSCSILYDALNTQDKQQLKFLKESQCGFRGDPLVCCGSYDNYRSKSTPELFGDDPSTWSSSNRRTNSGQNWDSNDDRLRWNVDNRRTNTDSNNNRRTNLSSNNRRTSSEESEWQTEDKGSRTRDRTSNIGSGGTSRRRNQGSSSNLPDRSTCGFQDVDRILDGQVTGLREFPWMALLQYRKKSGNLAFSCGGTLISSRYVLTAGHCVRGQILSKVGPLVNVRLGEYNTETEQDCSNQLGFEICNNKPVDSEIERVIIHPDYSDTNADRYHDVALIKLKRDVPTNDFIKPICLPTPSEKSNVGERLVVAGWGRTEYASSSPVKLKLWVPIAAASQCSSKFRSAGVTLGNKQLCAGGELGRDSCNGDSGGPLMRTTKNDSAQWYIEGIVSFGAKCGSQGWPGIYTRVAEYVEWIRSNAN
jgi:hypothetical protein